MTVIIVGPILLALGVSYGLHITNRYAEETGTKDEKIRQSLASTGAQYSYRCYNSHRIHIADFHSYEADRDCWNCSFWRNCNCLPFDNDDGSKSHIIT